MFLKGFFCFNIFFLYVLFVLKLIEDEFCLILLFFVIGRFVLLLIFFLLLLSKLVFFGILFFIIVFLFGIELYLELLRIFK